VDSSIDDTELVGLLAQLLRVVNPAAVTAAVGSLARAAGAGGENGARPADAAARPADAAGRPDAASRPDAGGLADAASLPDVASRPDASGLPDAAGLSDIAGLAVSASEARALIELVAARGIAQGQLASLLGLEKSTVSRLAAGLERKGWIRRGRDEENQRYIRLYLTPEGRLIAAEVWRAWQSRQARIIGSLSDEERAGLSAGLRGLVRGLAAEGLLGDAPAAVEAAPGA
jgi:DNA-binding MarR family transcriptional regulator